MASPRNPPASPLDFSNPRASFFFLCALLWPRGPVSDKTAAVPTEEEVDVLLKKLGACLRPEPFPVDQRRCCFCHQRGDGETDGPARLLNLDLDLWVSLWRRPSSP